MPNANGHAVSLLLYKQEPLKVVSAVYLSVGPGTKEEVVGSTILQAQKDRPGYSVGDIVSIPVLLGGEDHDKS